MPAIRDVSISQTTVATGATLTIPMPTSVLNDLLIAIITADTGTATWTSTGWTHVTGSPSTNTCQLVVMWKLAIASEAAAYTFTASAAESFTGSIISIQDVNISSPFGTPTQVTFANQAAAAKFSMPTVNSNVANSLILYAYASSAAGVPSFLEGPVYGLVAADGVAESLGLGWGFKASTGITPANVVCSNIATGAGRVMALQIAPPATGATIIPAYVTSDTSIYLDPLNGITAFNGNTGMAATADTNFATTFGAFTATDATLSSTATDVGINSFHSTARLTSSTGTQSLSGAELVFSVANRPNITGKNLLVHLGPSTEGQLQRFSKISSGRGIWFGVRSGVATNYKIWQVYGAELGSLRHQPVIINELSTGTKATAGTLDPTTILSCGFWVSGNGITNTAWDFAQLWVLGTTIVAGGNNTNPVNINGIANVVSTGKERKSVVVQGKQQMLVLQPLQLGNGGTDPLYLNLDASAIEFPAQYNQELKQVTYNSVDNVAGITYYAGATDTVIHTNATIISKNKFFWGFNPASHSAATYDFSGLSINGAGTVTLNQNIRLTDVRFIAADQITSAGNTLTNCIIQQSTAQSTQGGFLVSDSSQVALQAKLDKLVSCQFINNVAPGGALMIAYTGTTATSMTLGISTLLFSGNTYDIRWSATTGSNLTLQQSGVANATTYSATNANVVNLQIIKTFGKITFNSYLVSDGAAASYYLYYQQINTAGTSLIFGTKDAVVVKSLNTDLSGDLSYEVRGTLAGPISFVEFNYDFVDNVQASWVASNTYFAGDEYSLRVGRVTTWYRVTVNYTSGISWAALVDGANSTVLTGPSVVLVAIGTTNAEYFNVSATLVENATTVISCLPQEEYNYST